MNERKKSIETAIAKAWAEYEEASEETSSAIGAMKSCQFCNGYETCGPTRLFPTNLTPAFRRELRVLNAIAREEDIMKHIDALRYQLVTLDEAK